MDNMVLFPDFSTKNGIFLLKSLVVIRFLSIFATDNMLMNIRTNIIVRNKSRLFAPIHKTLITWGLVGLLTFLPMMVNAQTFNSPLRLSAKSNLLYDVALMPNIGIEVAVGKQLTIAASGTYGWLEGWPWHKNIRVVTGDIGVNYWFGKDTNQLMHRGFHIGPYAAVYRYDFLFGDEGQQAKANWGAGVALGYSVPVSPEISFDFSLGLGYVGGKYKEYDVVNDVFERFVWKADKVRHYVGPTKLEVALVWHLFGPKKKGGER